MKASHKLGDLVQITFTGTIEGVEVSVQRKLYICAVMYVGAFSTRADECNLRYSLCENDPEDRYDLGKTWINVREYQLTAIEPVIEAITKARLPASALAERAAAQNEACGPAAI